MNVLLILQFILVLCSSESLKSKPPSKEFLNKLSKLLLTKLGLSKAPTDEDHIGFSHFVKGYNARASRRDTSDKHGRQAAVSTVFARISHKSALHLVFPFKEDGMLRQNYIIKAAKLNFIPRHDLIQSKDTVTVYRKKIARYVVDLEELTERTLKKNKTLQINILDDLRAWQRTHGSKAEYRIKLKCEKKAVCIDLDSTPFIEFEYEMKLDEKPKNKDDECKKRECCLKTVRVSIKDLGWENWFFTPTFFDYHYCTGKCRGSKLYDKILMRILKNSTTCCAPVGLTGFQVIYTLKGVIQKKYLSNVMASGCSCGSIACS